MRGIVNGFALLLVASTTHAAPFADPFTPPRQTQSSARSDTGGAGGNERARLESVLIGPDRRIAVINGQRYAEGDRFGDGRVLRISEGEVVIRHAGRDEALKLFPEGARRAAAADSGVRRK